MYLDNSATTKTHTKVIETMIKVMETYWANPSSLHGPGAMAEKLLSQSRQIIAESMGVKTGEIYFTSGGTESCNTFIKGCLQAYKDRGRHIVASRTEHPAVIESLKNYEEKGWEITWLKVDKEGFISLKELENALRDDTVLTIIMHVNNETGSIQPIEEAGQIIANKSKSLFFVDGVQAFLKVPLNLSALNIDGYSISGHKIHGPKGSGLLYVRRGINLTPLMHGGGQERKLRSGTENLPAIAGLAKAVQLYSLEEKKAEERFQENKRKKERFIEVLKEQIPSLKINSPAIGRTSPYIMNISLPDIQGETILHALEESEIFVSTGSACSGKKKGYSPVLEAMGLEEKYLKGAIRLSLGLDQDLDEEDFYFFAKKLKEIYERLK